MKYIQKELAAACLHAKTTERKHWEDKKAQIAAK